MQVSARLFAVTLDTEMGTNCSTSPKTVDCLYDVASHAGLVPDASLDASMASLLSLNSSWALEQQYSAIQSGFSNPLKLAFNCDLHTYTGLNTTVSYGRVGVVALALSLLFDMLNHHFISMMRLRNREPQPPPDPIRRIFGANAGSNISVIASELLKQIPNATNDQARMTSLLESYETKLQTELDEFYGRMVSQESTALSSAGVKQWINGAALHIHTLLHWKRLTNSSAGEALSLRYLHRYEALLKSYRKYLLKEVKVFPALSPGSSGLLIVEPLRNVSHGVHHRDCECRAIKKALVERFLSDPNLQLGKQFFQSSHKHHADLMAQQGNFKFTWSYL